MRPVSAARLWDASEAAKHIRHFVAGKTESDFLGDLLLRSAVERQLEILGEALSRLRRDDLATAQRVPDLDRIVGMRNVIAHEYGDVDYEIVWAAVTNRIPGLLATLDVLLQEAGPPPEALDS